MGETHDALSELEVLSLAALMRLGPDAYGVSIADEIRERIGRSVSVSSLYRALRRLERRGLVRTSVGEPTPVRGGRAKKHFHISSDGRAALEAVMRSYAHMFEGAASPGKSK